jgi:C4-dicarboxylate-specific signal transduction histidine kinase
MFKTERESYQFKWDDIGDIEKGRPNLGNSINVAVYRLMQYSLRDVMIKMLSVEKANFRNYFRPDKEIADFKVAETITNTLSFIEDSFKKQNISIEVFAKNDPAIHGYRNEYMQVLLNILNNARDVLTEREIDDPKVTISIGMEGDRAVVRISDNAGGIPKEIINKIFDPYFTTKGPQQGTGVGLFMSKTIIEKNMDGRLSVCNIANGAEFRIEV